MIVILIIVWLLAGIASANNTIYVIDGKVWAVNGRALGFANPTPPGPWAAGIDPHLDTLAFAWHGSEGYLTNEFGFLRDNAGYFDLMPRPSVSLGPTYEVLYTNAAGQARWGIRMDGSDDYFVAAYDPKLGGSPRNTEHTIAFTAVPESEIQDAMILWGSGSVDPSMARWSGADSSNPSNVQYVVGSGSINAAPWPTNVYYHVVGTYSSTNGQLRLFTNGVFVASTTSGGWDNPRENRYFGFTYGAGAVERRWNGIITDFRFYTNKLSDTEVNALYTNTFQVAYDREDMQPLVRSAVSLPYTNADYYWPFDSSQYTNDAVGTNDLTDFGVTTVSNYINANSSYMSRSFSTVSSHTYSNSESTIAMWFRPVSQYGFFQLYDGSAGTLGVMHFTSSDAYGVDLNVNTETIPYWPGSVWTHVAIRYEKSGSDVGCTYFINGQPVPWAVNGEPAQTRLLRNCNEIRIGRNAGSFPGTGWFDDVAIWKRALSNREIWTLYQHGASTTYEVGEL